MSVVIVRDPGVEATIRDAEGSVVVLQEAEAATVRDDDSGVTVLQEAERAIVRDEASGVVVQQEPARVIIREEGPLVINVVGDAYYVHEQAVPADEWIIAHPLNKHPSVTIVDSAGTEVHSQVEYIDDSHIRLSFSGGFSGRAYLN